MEISDSIQLAEAYLSNPEDVLLEDVVRIIEKFLALCDSLEANHYVTAFSVSSVLELAEEQGLEITQQQAISFIKQFRGFGSGVYQRVQEEVWSWFELAAANLPPTSVIENEKEDVAVRPIELEEAVNVAKSYTVGQRSEEQVTDAYQGFLKHYHDTCCHVLFDADYIINMAQEDGLKVSREAATELVHKINSNMSDDLYTLIGESKLSAFEEFFGESGQ